MGREGKGMGRGGGERGVREGEGQRGQRGWEERERTWDGTRREGKGK